MNRPPETLAQRLADDRRRRRDQHRERTRRTVEPLKGMIVRVHDRVLVNFSSNDYLGLASTPCSGSSGSGASSLVTGYQSAHATLERALADFLQREAVVLTSSGYLANLAVITALAGRGDVVVEDRLAHASLIDAARLSGAKFLRYRHGDESSAAQQLEGTSGHRLLVTDGVFSMDGDEAPLASLARLAEQEQATLVVDDAHGIGVLGEQGGGLCELLGLGQTEVPVLTGTLGKAFGAGGAFIAGSQALIDHLVNAGRSVIYSTALAPGVAESAHRNLTLMINEPQRRLRLAENIEYFRSGAQSRGLRILPSRSAIQPLVVGAESQALDLSAALESAGFLVTAIRPPTVPEGSSRLRFTLSAVHEKEQIDRLLNSLSSALEEGIGLAPAQAVSGPEAKV